MLHGKNPADAKAFARGGSGAFNGGAAQAGTFRSSAQGTTTSVTPAALSNGPDEVSGIVMSGPGLLYVAYRALCLTNGASSFGVYGEMGLYLWNGTTESLIRGPDGTQWYCSGSASGIPDTGAFIYTGITGQNSGTLVCSRPNPSAGAESTPQTFGVPLPVWIASAGTYAVRAKYSRDPTGLATNVNASNRRLDVWAVVL